MPESLPPGTSLKKRLIDPASDGWWVLALLLVFALSALVSLSRESATFDETAHLPAGFTYLDRGDFRLNSEHPPLFKMWAALPLWIGGEVSADYASPAWRGRPVGDGVQRSKANEWTFGYRFLSGRDGPTRLEQGRRMMVVCGLLLGLIVFLWSREIWGSHGARLSLFLYCLSPTMLAHTRLVNTDLPTALAFTATLWTLSRFCATPQWRRLLALVVTLALSLLVKFSTLLLLPIGGLLLLVWVAWPAPPALRAQRLRWAAAAAAGALLVGYVGIWSAYGFRFSAAADPGYALDWDIVGLRSGTVWKAIRAAIDQRLLPESYLYGLAYFLGGSARRLAFLNGEQSIIGWWHYFPEAFLLKSPPALLIGSVATVAIGLTRHGWRKFEIWMLAGPAAAYWIVSILANLNIGHRHLAPIYPLLHLACGGLWRASVVSRRGRVAIAVLLAGYALSFGFATPRYLSYFNLLAGGSAGGWRYLLDSNIDWGQDLPRLRSYMDREGLSTIHLAYFGTAEPEAYGVRYEKVYRVHDFAPDRPQVRPGPGELVAISVNLLQGLYHDSERELADALVRAGRITPEPVHRWLDLRDRRSLAGERHPPLADWLVKQGFVDRASVLQIESTLLSNWFARIRDSLAPVARVGDSILVYRIPEGPWPADRS